MSFRDIVQEDSSPATQPVFQPVFHPVRDLIDNIRANREQRRQARHDRKEQAHIARNHNDGSDSVERPAQPGRTPRPGQPNDNISRPGQQPNDNIPRPMPPGPPTQLSDRVSSNIARPMPPGRPAQDGGTRGQQLAEGPAPRYYPPPAVRFAGYETKEPPAATPPGESRPSDQAEQNQPPGERLLPDTITIRERNGASSEVPEAKGISADDRLNGYLQSRGAQLAELDLNASSVSDKGLGLLSKAPNLAKLMLNDCDVDNESMKVLGKQGLRSLQELNLHSTRVGDEGIAQLKGMPLKVLNIADTATSDDCMQHIKTMKNLQVLNADYSGVGNDGVKAFREMPNLRSVSLKGCPVTDDCVKDLSQCQNLMLLNLEDTHLSSAKVLWLQRQMPRCVVIPPDGQGAAQGAHQHKSSGILGRLFESPRPRR